METENFLHQRNDGAHLRTIYFALHKCTDYCYCYCYLLLLQRLTNAERNVASSAKSERDNGKKTEREHYYKQ